MFSKKPKEFSDIPFPRWGLMAADGRLVLKGDSPSTSVEVVSKFAVRERCSFVTLSYEDAGVFINKHSLGGKTFSCNEGRVMPVEITGGMNSAFGKKHPAMTSTMSATHNCFSRQTIK